MTRKEIECRVKTKASGRKSLESFKPKYSNRLAHEIIEQNFKGQELKTTLKQLCFILDGLDVLIYVADMQTHEILFINKYGKDFYGDVTGKICWQTLQSGQTGPCEFCTNEKLVDADRNATGPYRWEHRNTCNNQWYDCHDIAIQWAGGRLVRMEMATNITKHKYLEKALHKNQARLQMSLKAADAGTWTWDVNTNAVFWDDRMQQIFGLAPGAFEGTIDAWKRHIHPDDAEAACAALFNALESDSHYEFECRVKDFSDEWHIVSMQGNVVEDGKGKPLHMTGMCVDVTMRKRAEAEREELLHKLDSKTSEMERLLRAVTHDLRSPLVNIHGFSQELALDCRHITQTICNEINIDENSVKDISFILNETIPESINYINTNIKKMERLLKGLGRLARIGRVELNIERIDMNFMLQNIIEASRFQSRRCGATVCFEPLPDCLGDNIQISQVFSNLLGNALKYLDPQKKGKIFIRGEVIGNTSIYSIEDNGVGIPESCQDKIFEVFHRIDPKGAIEGDGLGLTIVKQIVDRHDGKVWVKSKVGAGSTFFVSLRQ